MRFKIGDKASMTKLVTERDVTLFAEVTGDQNPAHTDEAWAKNTKFGTRIAHGMFSASLVSAVLGMRLPGPGTIYMGQKLEFTAPVRFNDTITAEVEVVEIIENKRLRLRTTVVNQEGKAVLAGEALVSPPRD